MINQIMSDKMQRLFLHNVMAEVGGEVQEEKRFYSVVRSGSVLRGPEYGYTGFIMLRDAGDGIRVYLRRRSVMSSQVHVISADEECRLTISRFLPAAVINKGKAFYFHSSKMGFLYI